MMKPLIFFTTTRQSYYFFANEHAPTDTQTAVVFLCTRVQAPDVDDYEKLARVMEYHRGTMAKPLVLESDGTNIIKWWADASYAVHPDMKSHTGGAMSLGKGTIYGTLSKQKLNTKSSTEAELVGVKRCYDASLADTLLLGSSRVFYFRLNCLSG